jgi:hypothetical protein
MNASVFNDRSFNGYLRRRIPHAQDDVVREFVREYLSASQAGRQAMTSRMSQQAAGVLGSFGERMGVVAVRTRSVEPLRLGLVAMGLAEGREDDPRANLYGLAVVNHSATELGTSLAALIDVVKSDLPPAALAAFTDFVGWKDRDKSLAAFGLGTAGQGDEFRYVPA